jgi:hypothetical protein
MFAVSMEICQRTRFQSTTSQAILRVFWFYPLILRILNYPFQSSVRLKLCEIFSSYMHAVYSILLIFFDICLLKQHLLKDTTRLIILFSQALWVKQGRPYIINVKMRRVRANIFEAEKQCVLLILSVRVCSLRYPAFNAHAPYCHLWPARLYYFSPHCPINGRLKKKEHKMCILILYKLCLKHFSFWR